MLRGGTYSICTMTGEVWLRTYVVRSRLGQVRPRDRFTATQVSTQREIDASTHWRRDI